MSFKECAEAYIKTHKAEWRSPKSLAAWEGTLGACVYPKFGNQPVQAVDLTLVMKALETDLAGQIGNGEPVARAASRRCSIGQRSRGYRQGRKTRRAGAVI